MSSSKLSKSNSKATTSNSNENTVFSNIVPSKIFNVSRNAKYPSVQPELNRKIAKLTNPVSLNYTTTIAKIMSVLRDREIVEYQQSLMKAAINNISEDTVDIDYIRIGLKLTQNDIDKLLDSEDGFCFVRNSKNNNRQERLTVNKMPNVGNKNNGFKAGDKKPYFTIGFRMFADKDEYRYINIFIAEHYNGRNDYRALKYNCSIEFIPTRLSLHLISFMLYQIKSVLEIRRYKQLFDNALLLELHTGYIMYGVSQLFGFMLTRNNKVKVGLVYPQEKDMATETAYVGSYASDHLIGYDKVLKENKMFIKDAVLGWDRVAKGLSGINDWFPNQVCSYRLESRRKFEKEPVKLADISTVKSLLEDVRLIRPERLFDLDDSQLEVLILDKSLKNCRDTQEILKAKNRERREQGKKGLSSQFMPNKQRIAESVGGCSELLLEAIRVPVKELTKKKKNYSVAVCEVSGIIQPLIDKTASKSHKVSAITKSKRRAIYVEGCPGSGKTSLVVKRVEHLLAQDIDASEISVLAFTNAAAKEFAERLDEKLPDNNSMFVGTFSSWCNKLLNFERDQKVLSAEAALKTIEGLVDPKSKIAKKLYLDEVARRCQTIFNHMANFDEPILERSIKKVAPDLTEFEDDISILLSAYNVYKKGRYRDFNDILVQLRMRLKDENFRHKVASKTKHLIIDEIQDTNKIQWDIIKKLYDHGIHFFCVGDPAQSMYGFRGAKHEYLDQFAETFKNRRCFKLAKNYRSTAPLVSLANAIRLKINPKYSISVSFNKSEQAVPPRLMSCDKLEDAIKWMVKDITGLQSSGTQLILCRYNRQVEAVEKALKKADVKHGDGKTIQVLTYHNGKGLEAEHCYVLDPQFSKCKLSSYKEELCNAYVALTRAKETLTILACNCGSSVYGKDDETGKQSGRSIFLDLPEKSLEFVD